jgi:hypothetical protein
VRAAHAGHGLLAGATALAKRNRSGVTGTGVGNSGQMTAEHTAGSLGSEAPTPVGGYVGDPAVQAEWDQRYADSGQLWSGQPNGALGAEVAGLTPGRALAR